MAGGDSSVGQHLSARRGFMSALRGTPSPGRLRGRGGRVVTGGELQPQRLVDHPHILIPDANGIGVPIYAANHAATVPMAGWDGETSAAAPSITKTI